MEKFRISCQRLPMLRQKIEKLFQFITIYTKTIMIEYNKVKSTLKNIVERGH